LGDVRLTKLYDLMKSLEERINNQNKQIDKSFFNEVINVWKEQLSVLEDSEDFNKIKNKIKELLSQLNEFLTFKNFKKLCFDLIGQSMYLCNLNMMKYIKQYLKDGVDIILFVGASHMDHLIEEINKLYPVNNSNLGNNLNLNSGNNNLNNNQTTWFYGKKRIKACDMEIGKIYKLRPKHSTSDLDLYKVIEKDDEKDEIKLAKLKTPAYPYSGVSKFRPKIMTLKISDNLIYGYEYDIPPNRNTSVFNENESN